MCDEVELELKRIWKLVTLARYEAAYQRAKKLYQKHPKNYRVLYRYAVCLGDRTGENRSKEARKNHQSAVKILKKLTYRIRAFEPSRRAAVLNEYYWFSHQPRKQYRLGLKETRNKNQNSFYSMGVGAWGMVELYARRNKLKLAIRWAQKSSDAWESYFKYQSRYYNAWVWYARAQGFLFGKAEMEKALKVAQRLSHRPKSYVEFREARREVLELRKLVNATS